jgi:hypothetical protein
MIVVKENFGNDHEHKAQRMLGDRYERPESSGKAPIDPEETFMQVINDMLASQWTMSQSLAQVVDRLDRVGTPDTQVPHAAQGNSGASSRPQSPSHTYTSVSRIPRPLFPNFQRAPLVAAPPPIPQRPPTHANDIAKYRREYTTLHRDFHQDMTLVEYCGLRLRNHRRGEDHNSSRGITSISSEKLGNSLSLLSTNHPNTQPELGYRS